MILIQCTDSKRDERSPARKLYDESAYFRKMRSYAEATGEMWFILSAKHGLVDPETMLEPYDERGLTDHQAKSIAAEVSKIAGHVEIIAGKDYTDNLTPELESFGVDVIELCRGQAIGERMQTLDRKVTELNNTNVS